MQQKRLNVEDDQLGGCSKLSQRQWTTIFTDLCLSKVFLQTLKDKIPHCLSALLIVQKPKVAPIDRKPSPPRGQMCLCSMISAGNGWFLCTRGKTPSLSTSDQDYHLKQFLAFGVGKFGGKLTAPRRSQHCSKATNNDHSFEKNMQKAAWLAAASSKVFHWAETGTRALSTEIRTSQRQGRDTLHRTTRGSTRKMLV